ncbi:MAG: bifunctional oligoribonuclease/PAP phosphatase NrnA [Actinobacteria bacterium]|nr:bifunctional oligoribonuclease/PAP phosphatase NrnA [Actinomycetota bacterium]
MIEREVLEDASALIRGSGSVVILGHQYPDGDAVGSVLGLGLMLRDLGKTVEVSWPEPFEVPGRLTFLPGLDMMVGPDKLEPEDLIVTVDCASRERLPDFNKILRGGFNVVNIDHHTDNTMFGTVNIVDKDAAATAEIVYLIHRDLGLELTEDAAVCLYTGILTDTGKFQFNNTSVETLKVASELAAAGVKPSWIYENVYQSDSLNYLLFTGDALSRCVLEEDTGLTYVFISQENLKRFGVRMSETEDLIDSLRALKTHRIAALFKELESGTIRVSMRSRNDIDIGSIARKLGGGGHKVAAGYTSSRNGFEDTLNELRREIIEAGWGTDNR